MGILVPSVNEYIDVGKKLLGYIETFKMIANARGKLLVKIARKEP